MKICINQFAFIAAIACISTALHTKHEPLSKETLRLMLDQSETLADNLKQLQDNLKTINQQNLQAQALDYKDKNITHKRRNEIRRIQKEAASNQTKAELQFRNIQRFLDSTTRQIVRATNQTSTKIRAMKLAQLRIPEH